jgi:hypothetical protein
MSFDLSAEAPLVRPSPQDINRRKATQIGTHMQELWSKLRDELGLSQEVMSEFANKNCTNALAYQVGDNVWLSTKNICTQRQSKKLDHKMVGLFKILRKIRYILYELELLLSMKIHNVFYSLLLWLAADDPLPGQQMPEPLAVIVNKEDG